MGSEKAANHVMERFPAGGGGSGVAITAIEHLSWRRKDQVRLAEHYLSTIPHANNLTYKAFATFMSLPLFLGLIEKNMPLEENQRDLLFYYLRPVLRKVAKSQCDIGLVAEFLGRYGRS